MAQKPLERNFRYINIIRKPNGELRSYDEYDYLERYERACDLSVYNNYPKDKALRIKDREYEKRK